MQSYCGLKLDNVSSKWHTKVSSTAFVAIQTIDRITEFLKLVTSFIEDAEKFFETLTQAQEAGTVKEILVHWIAWDSHAFCGRMREALLTITGDVMKGLKEHTFDNITSMQYNSMRMPAYVKALTLSTTFSETAWSLIGKLRPLTHKSPFCGL